MGVEHEKSTLATNQGQYGLIYLSACIHLYIKTCLSFFMYRDYNLPAGTVFNTNRLYTSFIYTVQSLYITPHYNTHLDIAGLCSGSQCFLPWNFTKNYRKMTIKWSFSSYSIVKLLFLTLFTYNMVHLYGLQT